METRQLAYFVLACHHRSHAEAAGLAGISPSTLSGALAALEAETGLTLFGRGPVGRYPTEAARWLCQIGERLLLATEAAASLPLDAGPQWLDVVSPLHLMLGRLYRAAGLAARRVRQDRPGLVARICFHSPLDPAPVDPSHARPGSGHECVNLSYDETGSIDPDLFLFDDDWVAVTNLAHSDAPDGAIGLATLARLPLELPPMLASLEQQGRRHCAVHGLPDPVCIDEDPGVFWRLSRRSQPFALLAPRSLVASGLQRCTLRALPLAPALRSPLVADIGTTGSAGAAYVRALRQALAHPAAAGAYRPAFTLRQMRYVLALAQERNISAAARRLNIVQPALSGQLRTLEHRLGAAVFERDREGLRPTRAGTQLEALARDIVACQDRIARESRSIGTAERHHVTVVVDPLAGLSLPLADALERWLEIYPNARLRIVEGSGLELTRWIDSREADFAIAPVQEGSLQRIDLVADHELGLLVARAHRLLEDGGVTLRDAAALPLMLPPPDHPWRRLFERAARQAGLQPAAMAEIASAPWVSALLPRVPVAALVTRAFARACHDAGALTFHPLTEPRLRTGLCVLFSGERGLRDSERMLVRLLRRALQPEPDRG